MKRKSLQIVSTLLIVCACSAVALAQGRGRGVGLGRRSDVFIDRDDRSDRQWDNRARVQDWKCGKFVNCHDARNGRLDGRGRRVSRNRLGNNGLSPRGARVGYRNRYDISDYWNRRHLMNGSRHSTDRWRYRSRSWRNR
jgi:hypothetical protein